MTTRTDVVLAARRYVGVPFRWGGRSTRGLDCVGLPLVVARDLEVAGWPRLWGDRECMAYAKVRAPGFLKAKLDGFAAAGILRRIDKDTLAPGDLVLRFGGFGHDHHVSILSGPNRMIEAHALPDRDRKHRCGKVIETTLLPSDYRSIMTGYQFAGVE